MGADMTISIIWHWEDADLDEKKMIAVLNKLKVVDQDERFYEFYENQGEEIPDAKTIKEDVKSLLLNIVPTIRDDNSRELTTTQLGTMVASISGGMSWGENPTDTMVSLDQLYVLPDEILQAGGFVTEPVDDFVYKLFLNQYKLPKKLKADLESWRCLEKMTEK